MKTILLDENLPRQLKQLFPPTDYRVFTVRELGQQNKKNGELLSVMTQNNIDILFTVDKNLQFQQNLDKYSIQLVVLLTVDNRRKTIEANFSIIEKELKKLSKNDKVFTIDIR